MRNRQHQFPVSTKQPFLFMVVLLSLVLCSCEKEEPLQGEVETLTTVEHRARLKPRKITICYTGRNGHCRILKIPKRAWRWYKRRGGVRLDDRDGDGYLPDNACGVGPMGDCDDRDPHINPGIAGSCDTSVDSDGDGVPDEEDACPDDVGLPDFEGCPDADGDGIADREDECPNEAGPLDNGGCPVVALNDYQILRLMYEANPGNNLGWDLTDETMQSWNGVFLDGNGKVLNLRFLFGTGITEIIPEIAELESLVEFVCACEGLQLVPPEIGQIESLISLGITGSQITDLPEEIAALPNLEGLAVFGNTSLSEIPVWIGGMGGLRFLNLSGNSLTEIPVELANLSELEILSLKNNPVTLIPKKVCDLADGDTEVLLDANDVCQQ